MLIGWLRRIIPERHPIRLLYHKLQAMLASLYYFFPSRKLHVIAITGTSGKSTTAYMIYYLLQKTGHQAGLMSTVCMAVGEECSTNESLRTSPSPWIMQHWLKRMVKKQCRFAVIEVSSHAIDQHRIWGINIDTIILTNISDNEHLDYHGSFDDYLQIKLNLLHALNSHHRKPDINKSLILNKDDKYFDRCEDITADKIWTFALYRSADIQAKNITMGQKGMEFMLQAPNQDIKIHSKILGEHNVANMTAAITTLIACKINIQDIAQQTKIFPGLMGRLEVIDEKQPFTVVVDFAYKPSALKAVIPTLRKITKGRIIVVWGGAGGRDKKNWQEAAMIIDNFADEFVLTTDDPYTEDPKMIVKCIQEVLKRKEGDRFFEIADRYEAIRYALFIAEPNDCVLIAGRGHETTQTIGKQTIDFDDRTITRELLRFVAKSNTTTQ